MSKYKITTEGLIPDNKGIFDNTTRPDGFSIGNEKIERNKCPEAYLLTDTEATLVDRARAVIWTILDKYKGIAPEDYTTEVSLQVVFDVIAGFKKKRLPVKKLRALVDKYKNSQYWSISLKQIKITAKAGTVGTFLVKTSNPDQVPEFEFTKTTHPSFFEADNQHDRAKALNIPDLYYYLLPSELDILEAVRYAFELVDTYENKNDTKVDTTPEIFLQVVSSPVTNALYGIGSNVRKVTPEDVKKERDKHGKQIDITEYMSNMGVPVQFENFNPFNNSRDITVGDPNTDKLLLQAQLVCIKTGQQAFEIPLSDFKTFRGLSDSKSALDQAKRACSTLLSARISVIAEDKHKGIIGGTNYVQECYVITQGQRSGKGNRIYINLSDKLYRHILLKSTEGQQIEQLDKRVAQIPNNQQTAYNIFRAYSTHLRSNVNRTTSHRLSVSKLLDYCSLLPLYPVNDSDLGKPNYLKYRSQAKDKIIRPFTNALDWLEDNQYIKHWTFTHTNGKPPTDDELKLVYDDYNLFSSLNVDVVFTNEPDYTHLLGAKAKRDTKTDKSKKRGKTAG